MSMMRPSLRYSPIALAVLLCSLAQADPAAARQAGNCSTLAADAKAVCEAAVKALATTRTLRMSVGLLNSCSLERVDARLNELLEGLSVVGQLPEDFRVQTAAVTQGGTEFQKRFRFYGEPEEIVDSLEAGLLPNPSDCVVDPKQRADLEAALSPLVRAIAAYNKPLQVRGALQLRKLANTWSWVITDGFGQFPWERLVNDLVHRAPMSIYQLPKTEWVVVHPSVGVTLTGLKDLDDVRGHMALFVEPLGFVRYSFDVDSEARKYWGASGLVVVTENTPLALGALLRYNKYSIGAARSLRSGEDGGTWQVTATVELLERLQPARKKLQQVTARAATTRADPATP